MSLLEALSAPVEYTMGAASGNFGERRTGEDITGDITSGILLEIIADPLNLVGLGLGATGALTSKIVRRLDKFSEWNKATDRITKTQAFAQRLMDEEVLERQMAKTAVGGDFFRGATTETRKRNLLDIVLGDVRRMDAERGVMFHGTSTPFDEGGIPKWNMEEAIEGGRFRPGTGGQEASRGPGFYNANTEAEARYFSTELGNYKQGLTAKDTSNVRSLMSSTADELREAGRFEDDFVKASLDDLHVQVMDGIKGFESGGVGKAHLGTRAAAINPDTVGSLNRAAHALDRMAFEADMRYMSKEFLKKVGVEPSHLDGGRLTEGVSETINDILKAKTPDEGYNPTVYRSRIRTDTPLDVRKGVEKVPQEEAARIYERLGLPEPTGAVTAEEVGKQLSKHRIENPGLPGEAEHAVLESLGYDSLIHTREGEGAASDILTWDPEKMFSGISRRYRPMSSEEVGGATLRDVLDTYREAAGGLDRVDAARAVGGGALGYGATATGRGLFGAYDEEEEL